MRNKIFLKTIGVFTICVSFVLTSCGCNSNHNQPQNDDTEQVEKHTHTPSSDWSKDEIGHWHTCSGCDEKLDYAEHTFSDWKITKEATCTETGEKERTCTVCGQVQSEIIAKKEHEFDTAWSSDETSHWHSCKNCDEKSDVADHDFEEPVIAKEPNCFEDGLKVEVCKVCGYKKETIIPKLEHTTDKTWSYNSLYHWHTCSKCGDHVGEEVHQFETLDTKPSTCSEEGYILKECKCGYKVKVVLPKLPHTEISNIQVVKPTISTDGTLSGTCVCGKTIKLRYPSIKEMITNKLIEPLSVNAEKQGKVMLTGKETRNILEYILAETTTEALSLQSLVPFANSIGGDSIDYIFPTTTISIKDGTDYYEGAVLIIDCGADLGISELGPLPAFDKTDTENFRAEESASKTKYYLTDTCIENLLKGNLIFSKNSYVINLLKTHLIKAIIK